MRSLPENIYGPYVVPLIPDKVTMIVPLCTPARSSAIHKVIGAVVRTIVDHALGIADHAMSHGLIGALKLVEMVPILLFRSFTFPVIVISFSIPYSKSAQEAILTV